MFSSVAAEPRLALPFLALIAAGCVVAETQHDPVLPLAGAVGDVAAVDVAVPSAARTKVVELALGDTHSCALFEDGRVRCWGTPYTIRPSEHAARVFGDDEPARDAPYVPLGGRAVQLSTRGSTTCALLEGGEVRCWGPEARQFARQRPTDQEGGSAAVGEVFTVDVGEPALRISVGSNHACALLAKGRVRCWGSDWKEALGFPSPDEKRSRKTPRELGDVPVGEPVLEVAAGDGETCVRLAEGRVRCWGERAFEYPARPVAGTKARPRGAKDAALPPADPFVPAAAIALHDDVCLLLVSGAVRCWGRNYLGDTGSGQSDFLHEEDDARVGDIALGGRALTIARHRAHVCALLDGGDLRCWGEGTYGALGLGDGAHIGDDEVPRSRDAVPVGGPVVAVATGGTHSCAILASNAVRCWGGNSGGQLGLGTLDSRFAYRRPVDVGDVPVHDGDPPSSVEWTVPTRLDRQASELRESVPFDWPEAAVTSPAGEAEPAPSLPACEKACAGCRPLVRARAHAVKAQRLSTSAASGALVNLAYARYLTSERCMTDPSVATLDPAAIGSRQDDSSLYGLVHGSFTEAGKKQQIALLFVGHCGHLGAHFEHYGNRILAVIEGDRVLGVSVDESGLQSIDAVDVDGDGRDEVVAVGGFANTGCAEEWTVVLSFASGFAKTVASFTTYEGCCDSFAPESFTEGTLRYRPAKNGRPACIDERTRTRKCAPLR